MIRYFSRVFAVSVIASVCLAVAAPALAQRGGRGGGRGEAAPEAPASKTLYDNKQLGVRFEVPPGVQLYTPESPGRYRSTFTERKIVLMVNPTLPDSSLAIKYADGMTEADLQGYQRVLEANPPQAKLPGYEKVSLATVKIGKDGAEDAVEFVYRASQDGQVVTIRQVVFVHNGRGFTVTCSAPNQSFSDANGHWFDVVLKKLEFS